MPSVHLVLGLSVLITNAIAAVWGFLAWRGTLSAGRAFTQVLALSQTVAIGQGILGLLLLSGDRRAPDQLHYVYGLLPLALIVFAYSARTDDQRRNLLVFSIAAALIAGLATRAYLTGHG